MMRRSGARLGHDLLGMASLYRRKGEGDKEGFDGWMWEHAAKAFTDRLQDMQQPLPTANEYADAANGILNRSYNSAAMAYAFAQSVPAEHNVPLRVVLALSRGAADVRRAEYVQHTIESATNPRAVQQDASAAREGSAPATAGGDDSYYVRNNDRLWVVFDSAMRHVAALCQRRSRTSQFYEVDTSSTVTGSATEPAASKDAAAANPEPELWEAAIAIMGHAHFCGVLQHEYDGPGEDLRINATSRIWRNFGHAFSSEVVGSKPGRAAWENALTILAYTTPVPRRDAPPCCGFTTQEDELTLLRATEEALGRADRRWELLNTHQFVRNKQLGVNRHVCVSEDVAAFAKAQAARIKGAGDATPLGRRELWGLEQDARGDACITNLLRTVAPNAWRGDADPVAQLPGGGGSRLPPFCDRSWRRTPEETAAVDEALSRSISAPPPVAGWRS